MPKDNGAFKIRLHLRNSDEYTEPTKEEMVERLSSFFDGPNFRASSSYSRGQWITNPAYSDTATNTSMGARIMLENGLLR